MQKKQQQWHFQTGLIRTEHRWLEDRNFGFRKERNCTIHVAKTKVLISFAVTAKLICTFGFAYAYCWFSPETAPIQNTILITGSNLISRTIAATVIKMHDLCYRNLVVFFLLQFSVQYMYIVLVNIWFTV